MHLLLAGEHRWSGVAWLVHQSYCSGLWDSGALTWTWPRLVPSSPTPTPSAAWWPQEDHQTRWVSPRWNCPGLSLSHTLAETEKSKKEPNPDLLSFNCYSETFVLFYCRVGERWPVQWQPTQTSTQRTSHSTWTSTPRWWRWRTSSCNRLGLYCAHAVVFIFSDNGLI